ncbi:Anthocyanidin reductase protein, partial [Dioscorea alata]
EQFQSTIEAVVAGVRIILKYCEFSGTMRRIIYTGSITAMSPLKQDGTSFNHTIDESCWTPLCFSFSHYEDHEKSAFALTTLAKKEILNYNNLKEKKGMEIVSLACGLVGGNTLLPYMPTSVRVVLAPLSGEEQCYRQLHILQGLLGSIPLVHIDDVFEAHIFYIEKPSMAGRYLCANGYPLIHDFAQHFTCKYSQMEMIKVEDE